MVVTWRVSSSSVPPWPLSLTYKGTAKFTDKDQAGRTIAIEVAGKETRGAGNVSAAVQATLKPGDGADSIAFAIRRLTRKKSS